MSSRDEIADLVGRVAAAARLATADPVDVAGHCDRLRRYFPLPDPAPLHPLGDLLGERAGAVLVPVFDLLAEAAAGLADPWPLFRSLLGARDPSLARRALRLAAERDALPGGAILAAIAERVEIDDSPFAGPDAIADAGRILARAGPLTGHFLDARDESVRRLAARILDLSGEPAPPETARQLLAPADHDFLAGYLDYTRASHLDLSHLTAGTVAAMRRAEEVAGFELLREVVASLGWARVNHGIEAKRLAGFVTGGALPLFVPPYAASLLDGADGLRRAGESVIFFAHGGEAGSPDNARETGAPVDRFRTLNLRHAALLERILDLAPLTKERVQSLVADMGAVVEDFIALFANLSEECALLPGAWRDLRDAIARELGREAGREHLSPELTRLVNAFEDPRNLGEVRTLHGLKRYLHQRGLRLGFSFVGAGRAPRRTADVVVATKGRLASAKVVKYADFSGDAGLPWPVRAALDGIARQLLAGQEKFPWVEVHSYGNEVHVYLSFRNHPAFLRLDLSPPLRGGMVDLEFFGVSNYELDAHPAPGLESLRAFLAALGFDVEVRGTRVHARADKESVVDLGTLCDRAAAMLRLAPYLMDLDWVLGSLDLPPGARETLAEEWAASFARHGALPLRALLTKDRRGVLAAIERGPLGEKEIPWTGEGPPGDRFGGPPLPGLLDRLAAGLAALRLPEPSFGGEDRRRALGQIRLEETVLTPLAEALARGEIIPGPEGPRPASGRRHEAVRFAELLAEGEAAVAEAVACARLTGPVARTLSFRTIGHVAGRDVLSARLGLPGEGLALSVLRDEAGIIRLARCPGVPLPALAGKLRRANFPLVEVEPSSSEAREEARRLLREIAAGDLVREPGPLPGERVITGLPAAPGRTSGHAVFGNGDTPAEALEGAILVKAAVRPEDTPGLYRAAGVVSTGGGALSHAGLIALQFRKPALVIPGRWTADASGAPILLFTVPEYREEEYEVRGFRIGERRNLREREHRLVEGDLLVLNATAGTLRVLGQDRDTLALAEGLRHLAKAEQCLGAAPSDADALVLRGRRLRARHQVAKVLGRLVDPVLARFAVRELLLGETVTDREELLATLGQNPAVTAVVPTFVAQTARELEARRRRAFRRAEDRIPRAIGLFEVLAPRLEALRATRALAGPAGGAPSTAPLDVLARRRLHELRDAAAISISPEHPHLRHLLRRAARADALLGTPEGGHEDLARPARDLAARDAERERRLAGRTILTAADGGFELLPLAGAKAANLAETARILGAEFVPPWFTVTDAALRRVLDCPLAEVAPRLAAERSRSGSLRAAIDTVLARDGPTAAEKAALIRGLFAEVRPPKDLAEEIGSAYRALGPDGEETFVAVRSSSREEDAEAASRAGEFETFLFVRGEAALLETLANCWSGLWTERAIHNRTLFGPGAGGGGVLVQRMVDSRVSGVLLTVDVARGEEGEMVINAGLGLGEGIVSGTVAADHVTVSKEGDLTRGGFRMSYAVADKRERIVFDRRAGRGTIRAESLYHQRLRPALEYVELAELVRLAARLEEVFGHPVDVEFGIERSRVFILQVRPVPVLLPALEATLGRFPLSAGSEEWS
ncbi:MAG: PEP-utilizing enzyme [Planctomycetes bacterium]|nr:PEP-utilizing enzyme [Planctomycetota bacterium]